MSKETHPPEYISSFQGALHAKCPRCRRGKMFANNMYEFSAQKMNEKCPHCGLYFEREPGYFYVAMFVSYALTVAELLTLAIGTYLLTHSNSPWLYSGILIASSFLCAPFNYRYSRVILLYWLSPGLHYRADMAKDHPEVK